MNKKTARPVALRWLGTLAVPVVVGLLMAGSMMVSEVQAQEQFFTQSGGRGLQNAKTNARLSKVEGDVDVLNVEMAKVKPHAKAELGSCPDTGDKLRYTGSNWVCDRETDPTVQGFAKKSLPSCTGGSILGVQGGEFACVQSGFVSNETDPTVQGFAKVPLPGCGADQVLKVSNGNLACVTDQVGLSRETDPNVHSFARTDTHPALPNCGTNELLTMVNGNLLCKVDSVGIMQEVDPFTASFARTDIPGYALAACGTGELLRSVTEGTNVVLKCEPAGDSIGEAIALNDLSDVDTTGQVSGTVLMYNGTEWRAMTENDPTVPSWAKSTITACTAGQVITYDGTNLVCVNDAGGGNDPLTFAGLADVNVSGVADGRFVKYDLASQKWVPGTVAEFAQTSLPVCSTGQVLTGDGTNLSCVSDAGGAADPVDLVELGDVRTGPSTNLSPNNNDFLRYNTSTSKWDAVHDKLSGVLTADNWCRFDGTNVVCDRGAPSQCPAGEVLNWNTAGNTFECVAVETALGLGTMAYQNSNAVSITGGVIDGTVIGGTTPAAGTFTNLTVGGTVSASYFVGDGSQITNLPGSALTAAGIVGSVQFKGSANELSGTSDFTYLNRNLSVPGTVQVAGTGSETCGAGAKGQIRMVDLGGGDVRLQVCR